MIDPFFKEFDLLIGKIIDTLKFGFNKRCCCFYLGDVFFLPF